MNLINRIEKEFRGHAELLSLCSLFKKYGGAVAGGGLWIWAGGRRVRFARSGLAVRGTGEGFDGVAAQKFAPVVIEEIAGREDVAPGNFAAVGHHHANDTLTL